MTLLVAAVLPIGIVLGADSAMTDHLNGQVRVFTGFPKIVSSDRLGGIGIAIAGDAQVGHDQTWVSEWVDQFVSDQSAAVDLDGLARELAEALDAESHGNDSITFLLAGWTKLDGSPGRDIPALLEVSRGRADSPRYSIGNPLDPSRVDDIAAFITSKRRRKTYSWVLLSAGQPDRYINWFRRDALPSYLKLVKARALPMKLDAWDRLVRFAIANIAEMHRIAGTLPVVSEPLQTLILPRQPMGMVMRGP